MKKWRNKAGWLALLFFFFALPSLAHAEKDVILDPGHGGSFKGTTGYSEHDGFVEKEANLSVGLRVRDILQSATDLKVFMTRDTDRDFGSTKPEDLAKRMEIANAYARGNNDHAIFISIHHNFRYDYDLHGAKTFYYNDEEAGDPNYPADPKQLQYKAESKELANIVQSSVVNNVGVKDDGVHGDRAYFVIRNAEMPAVLAELGYMSNPKEEARIRTPQYQQKEARALANAVGLYFNIWSGDPVNTQTIKGSDRIHTAIAVSRALYPNGFSNGKDQKVVVLARYDQYADALSAAPLAAHDGYAPILLTLNNTLPNDVIKEIHRLGAKKVVLIGGENVVSDRIKKTLESKGYKVNRLAGSDRYATNRAINQQLDFHWAFVVSGSKFADALSTATVAVNHYAPIFLTGKQNMPKATLEQLKGKRVFIVGGPGVVSRHVEKEIAAQNGGRVTRLAGEDRYETLAAVLRAFDQQDRAKNLYVSTGDKFPDALTASVLAGKQNVPLVLAGKSLNPDLASFLSNYDGRYYVNEIKRIGGTLPLSVVKEIKNHLPE